MEGNILYRGSLSRKGTNKRTKRKARGGIYLSIRKFGQSRVKKHLVNRHFPLVSNFKKSEQVGGFLKIDWGVLRAAAMLLLETPPSRLPSFSFPGEGGGWLVLHNTTFHNLQSSTSSLILDG